MEGATGKEETIVSMTGKEAETSRRRRKVTAEERKKISDYFEPLILSKKVPGQKQCCQYIITAKSALDWKSVKYGVYARVQGLKK